MKKILIVLIVVMGFLSLSAKPVIVENPMNPKVKTYTLVKTAEINLGDEASVIQDYIVNDDKIYICDMQSKMALIFDFNGDVVAFIDKTGNGPGELSMPTNIFIDSKNKRFGVVDQLNRRVSYFSYSGDYIEDVNFAGMEVPVKYEYSGDYMIEFVMGIEFNQEKGTILSKPTLRVGKDEEKVILFSDSFNPLEMNIGGNNIPVYSISNELMYISRMNPDNYHIEVKNFQGEHLMNIDKKYKKIIKTEEEIEEIEARLDDVKRQVEASGADIKMDFSGYEYDNSINAIITDAENHIWVFTQNKNNTIFDIYNDKGEIIAQCDPKEELRNPKFYKGEIFDLTGDEDDGYSIVRYKIQK